ncbi:MAG: SHOCT domain-containing protein [Actinomycetota bacterium]|nr:SHOCT domain-containing protein [Actinomycetota bacterium]
MMWWYPNGMGGWGAAGMIVSMVLFWALVIVGITALVRLLTRHPPTAAPRSTPEQVLGKRFARGDIDEQEYRRIRDALHEPRPAPIP